MIEVVRNVNSITGSIYYHRIFFLFFLKSSSNYIFSPCIERIFMLVCTNICKYVKAFLNSTRCDHSLLHNWPWCDSNNIAEEFFDFVFICSLAPDLFSLVSGLLICLVSRKSRNLKPKMCLIESNKKIAVEIVDK